MNSCVHFVGLEGELDSALRRDTMPLWSRNFVTVWQNLSDLSREYLMSFHGNARRNLPVLLGLLAFTVQQVEAADFAVETKVFSAHDKNPVSTHLAVFRDGVVYDFQLTPVRSATSFDTKTRRFTLTDKTNEAQTAIAAKDLIQFAAQLRQKAVSSDDPLVRFAADPVFEEKYDAKNNQLVLSSKRWEYRVKTKTFEDEQILKQYREFADWFTYLNSMFRPLPPGLRLKLNRALGQHDCFAEEVAVTIQIGRRKIEQRSEHKFVAELGQREIDMISEFRANHARFQSVEFPKYRELVRVDD